MKLANCPRCGRLFVFVTRNLCPACMEEEEKEFARVRDYLEEYPQKTVGELAAATNVDPGHIYEFLKQGRLAASNFRGKVEWECETCGAPISFGRLCPRCLKQMQRELAVERGAAQPAVKLDQGQIREKGKIHLRRLRRQWGEEEN